MSVERIPDELSAEAARVSASSVGNAQRQRTQETDRSREALDKPNADPAQRWTSEDKLNVSPLTQFMADTKVALEKEMAIRQDKLDDVRSRLGKDFDISDQQIDTIIDRMLNN
ncbi:MAG: hypothetical protein HY343_09095 [Lentisphaerae bacterium]|nr:hypothetical protein [Lentisphaerota bacterium]